MPEGNPLVAKAQSQTTGVTGIGIAESAVDLANGVKDGSWVEGGLGALGVGLEVLSLALDPIGTLAQYGVSWLIEHVKPLKDCLDWLAGDPPVIQSYSETWANVAKEVTAIAGDLNSEGKNGTAGWVGQAGDAYRGEVAEQADAIAGAATLADGISTGVMVMGQVVAMVRETVRDLLAELVGKLITWALEEACTLGFATPLVAAQATAAITKAISKVGDLVRKLVKTIGNVAPKIRKIVDKLGEIIEKLSKLGKKLGGHGGTTPSAAKAGRKVDAPDIGGPHHAPDGPGGVDAPPHTPDGPGGIGGNRGAGGKGDNGIKRNMDKPRDDAQPTECLPGSGDPIDSLTGTMFLPQTDVGLAAVLPLELQRTHRSTYRAGRFFGPSWASTFDQRLEVEDDGVYFADPDGVLLVYPHPPADGAAVFATEGPRWPLARTEDGGYLLSQPLTGRTLHFSSAGTDVRPLVAVTDRNGNRIDFHYDSAGMPAAVEHSGGYRIVVDCEAGHITGLKLANPGGEDISLVGYRYDGDRLTEVINSSGRPMRFEYDQAGRITRWEDRNGEWYRFIYDGAGRCFRTEASGDALTGTLDIDTAERVSVWTNSLGHATTYHFNEANQVVRLVDALGGDTVQEWDRYDRLLSRTDPLGRTTRYVYDELGNIVEITRPDSTQVLAEYDSNQQRTAVVDADGAVWRNTYDERGNLLTATDPAGATTRYTYDERGHVSAITDPMGATRRVECDAAGLPVAVTDPLGATTRFVRDQFGRTTTLIDPIGAVTRFAWTVEGKPGERIRPDGATDRWRFDAEGSQIEHTDPLGHTSRTETTHFDLASARIAADGSRVEYLYDSELRLVAITNQQGLVWRYTYDPVGRLTGETDYNGHTVGYTYDAAGQLVERVNGAGQTTRYVRDPLGRVLERHSEHDTARFAYDPMGRLLRTTNRDADVEFTYDAAGRITSETVNGRTLTSTYNPAGRRIHRRTPTGAESHWDYDANQLPAALRTASRTMTFGFDPAGREIERLLDTGTIISHSWDTTDRITRQTVSTVAGTNTAAAARLIQQRHYTYRPDGHLSTINDHTSGTRRFDLDPVGRITAAQGTAAGERYAYDPAGNITAAAWPSPDTDNQGVREYQGSLLQRAGNTHYRHDAHGRVVLRQKQRLSAKPDTWHYSWDADDRLVEVITPDHSRWHYRYDPLGRRIAKQRLAVDGTTVAEQVDFTWDGTTLAEQVHSSGHATTWDYEPGSFRPVTQTERVPAVGAPQQWIDARFYSIVTDLVGAPSELITTTGALAWRAENTVWGAALADVTSTVSTPLRFPGQYHDPETGLHYNFHRYYDPASARYLSGDPLGLAPSPNPHAYVFNPAQWADPLGLKCVTAGQVGSYGELTPGQVGDRLTPNHMPQTALGFTPHNDGGCIVMPQAEHELTRTYGWKGRLTKAEDAGMSFRDVLAKDIWDLRSIGQQVHGNPGHYNESIKQLLDYYRKNFPELMER